MRSRYFAARVGTVDPPLDTVHFALFHPARRGTGEEEIQTGVLPPDDSAAPWPLLIWLGGINVNPATYGWLGRAMAARGVATITFSHVGTISPGSVGLSPGLDIGALTPDTFGSRPSATTIGPLLDAVRDDIDRDLADRIDLDAVVVGGHSAGGTVALLNANPEWFPGIRGAVSYAGHTRPAALLGHPPGTILEVPGDVPALVIGGSDDGIIAASTTRYELAEGEEADPLVATFDQGTRAGGSALALIDGATHETICHPLDPSSARGFLEATDTAPEEHRTTIDALVATFIGSIASGRGDGVSWDQIAQRPDLAEFRLR